MNDTGRKSYFFEALNDFYKSKGFVYKKSRNSFVLKESSTKNEFIISYEIWPYFAQVEASYEILLQDVEKIKKGAWGKEYRKFVSVGIQKSYLASDYSLGISLTDTHKNVKKAITNEIDFWKTKVKVYFSMYSNISFLDEILNNDIGKNLYVAYNPVHTSFLAIIVAYLNQRPFLEEVIAFYSNVVDLHNPAFQNDFKVLANYILNLQRPADQPL